MNIFVKERENNSKNINNIYMIPIKHLIAAVATLLTLFSSSVLMAQSSSIQPQNKIAIAAHRGFWKTEAAGMAQNSIASLKAAQDNRFWGSECDVQLTSDDVILVNHDNTIQETSIWYNPYSVLKEKTLANGEHPSTLDQYLDQTNLSETTVLVLELKAQENADREILLVDKCLQTIKSHNLYNTSRIIFISFSINICKKLAKDAPNFMVQYLAGDMTPTQLHEFGIGGIDYEQHVLQKHPDYVSEAHGLGMEVNAWTVNKEADIRKMIDLGVDCITTNEPLLVREMLGEREIRIAAPEKDNPKANPIAEVRKGNVRFTVLTSRLIRMEWSENGQFEDRATLGIVNRNLPVPPFSSKINGNKITIRTSDLTLTYNGDGKFDENNLSVTFNMTDKSSRNGSKKVTWHPGADDSGNLLGTCRTLDRCDGEKTMDPFDKGVISKDGWAVIDESERQVMAADDSDWHNWVAERDSSAKQDLYMFAYGHDYKAAVSDFTKIGGKIPLPPKYSLGYWWCRYWQYSDFEFINLAKEIRSFDIPIDVMVLDMDWHYISWPDIPTKEGKDEFGQGIGWTGYTWNNSLFPNPANCLADLHHLGLKTTLNLHPASGIRTFEEPYQRFVKDYLSRTSDYDGPKDFIKEDGSKASVPFRIDQQAWADAYFNSVIHPLEKQGVDFWWLDWQQWKLSKYVPGLSNTFWLNFTFFNDMVRKSAKDGIYAQRPMIYHRWGGIGSHRYQIGFSGDTYATWKVLGYLPYFTSTASNVGYGYWGHDIGGHMQHKTTIPKVTNPELYTRWLQYGVFTPIFKTHSTKDMTMEKRFWMFPEYFDAMRKAIRLRYSLSPYIYNAARQTYDSGISMCRPMYYDYAENENSYSYKQQYMFGDDILATVICEPADSVTGLSQRSVWLPDGDKWYDMATGKMYEGGSTATLSYTIDENPYFVRAGAIIPMASEHISSLQVKSNELRLFVAPGDGQSETSVYEDDGSTQAYKTEFATTKINKTSDAQSVTVTIAPREGSYAEADSKRLIRVVLEGVFAPSEVTVNGEKVNYDRFADYDTASDKSLAVWSYDGTNLSATVYVPEKSVSEEVIVRCSYDASQDAALIFGKKGLIHRMMALTPEAKLQLRLANLPTDFLNIAQCGSYITEDPMNSTKYLKQIDIEAADKSFDGTSADAGFISEVKSLLKL